MKTKIFLLLLLSLLFGCTERNLQKSKKPEPGFSEFISGYTDGIISAGSVISIQLAQPVEEEIMNNDELSTKLFRFSPEIKGDVFWRNENTIEFKPKQKLKSGEVYTGLFYLGKIKKVPEKFKEFPVSFQIIKQTFSVDVESLKAQEDKEGDYYLKGVLKTSDIMDNQDIQKLLKVNFDGASLPVTWTHDYELKTHTFLVENIIRGEEKNEIEIIWDGSDFGIPEKGKTVVDIPKLSEFRLMGYRVIQMPEQHVILQFSDPLLKDQKLDGTVIIKGQNKVKLSISGNEIKLYPSSVLQGTHELQIFSHLKNTRNVKLSKPVIKKITFQSIKPEVKLIGKGTIIPGSEGLIFPFEAVNLAAVDVTIVKIFENNIPQFLQVNSLDGNNQLRRVGRKILKKKVELKSDRIIDYGKWNAFSIDLADLIDVESGAIYRIEISFKRAYSLYSCGGDLNEEVEPEEEDGWDDEEELSYWDADGYDYGYSYYPEGFNWQDRDNPCSPSYYNYNRWVSKNILASDLGLIAKSGSDNFLHVNTTDLKTTQPVGDVGLEVLNYQNQAIGNAFTDSEGKAKIPVLGKPFLLVASKGDQKGYLKLNDGSALPLSRFDVSGKVVQKGLKGFIYGERDVWRPGDTLYISFMMEDKEDRLPAEHPVIFELYNPDGKKVKRIVKSENSGGLYSFVTSTEQDAPTGNWSAMVKAGGVTFSKRIRIETVKPNRLKINLDLGTDLISASDKNITGYITSKWLHGAVARNLRAKVDVVFKPGKTTFKGYESFVFDDPTRDYTPEEQTIYDGRLSDSGKAFINAPAKHGSSAPGMLTAVFTSRVFEEGGDFSIDQFSLPYAPYPAFAGVRMPAGDKKRGMLLTDKLHDVEVVTLNSEGKPVARKNIEVEFYKIQWRWWWDTSEEYLASYSGTSYKRPVLKKTLDTDPSGKGKFQFKINSENWGRYLIRVILPDGHATGQIFFIDWPGWAGKPMSDGGGAASMLMLSADKEKYEVGEKATVTFPSTSGGRALISVENGSKIVSSYWVNTTDNQTSCTFQVTEKMSPNIYANVLLLQPHNQSRNDLPIRMFGVIPLKVEDPRTILYPELEMDDELRSESMVKMNISEKSGKKMNYTIAVVDEGLLDLTRFKTPDPWQSFYAREALGVKTWDIYDHILGAFGSKLETMFAIGGDGFIKPQDKNKANRFKPVVKYLGPFTLLKGETNNHKFKLSPYIGSVRVMVVACNDGAYGKTDKAVPVKNPLMVLATMPRVLSPKDEVRLPVSVFAMDNSIKSVKVKVETNNLLEVTDSSSAKVLEFSSAGEKDIDFKVRVSDKQGIAKAKVTVEGGGESAWHEIELDVRHPNIPVTFNESFTVQPGETLSEKYELFGIEGSRKAKVEISKVPSLNLEKRLKYLIRYPHGCVEQITSSVFPQLYLSDMVKLSESQLQEVTRNIRDGINRLRNFQSTSGGFNYWPGNQYPNEWGTSYAGHFLLEAEKKGYDLPSGLISMWMDYQKTKANNWRFDNYNSRSSQLNQAYRLYTLALANNPQYGAMNRLREQDGLIPAARWRLAAAYAIAGQSDAAEEMVDIRNLTIKEYRELSGTFGSATRDKAMLLETLVILKKYEEAWPLMESISESLSSPEWMSTQTTAYSLIAMSRATGEKQKGMPNLRYDIKIGDRQTTEVDSEEIVSEHELPVEGSSNNAISVKNNMESVIFVNLVKEGIPEIGSELSGEKNLEMTVKYEDMNGSEISVGRLEQGTDFKALVKIKNAAYPGSIDELALTQVFPSGWEIINTRLFEGVSNSGEEGFKYRDIRDDRVMTYFDLDRFNEKTFEVILNAAYVGKYYLPGTNCEAMYDNRIYSRKAGKQVEVVRPGE